MVVVHRSLLYFPLNATILSVSNQKTDILTPLNLKALIFSCSGNQRMQNTNENGGLSLDTEGHPAV